ncbi:glycosyltransferase [Lentibacter algarum]|uniref:glycosyltransferase family 2 protein n=1 Tax=Lentibacter algarum TaxID=576131 RepID=UPI001C064E04|nr:glycosyltransferase family 2 protein [Lentibacter algarum]MBU2981272.1 glycosyltransferase [Lentibacter algarum]
MTEAADISLIVPSYNTAAEVLEACLQGLFDMEARPEIIVVDDCSDVPLEARLSARALRRIDKLVRLPQNSGAFEARRAGAAVATRRFVQFADADDWVDPVLYSQLGGALDKADIVAFRAMTKARDGALTLRGKPDTAHVITDRGELMKQFFGFRYLFALWNKLYRRSVLLTAFEQLSAPVKAFHGDDFLLNAAVFWLAERFEHVEVLGYHYVQHAGQGTASDTGGDTGGYFDRVMRDQGEIMQRVESFLRAQEGLGREQALAAFYERQFHATLRVFTGAFGAEKPADDDRFLHSEDARIAQYTPWARHIARQQNTIQKLKADLVNARAK